MYATYDTGSNAHEQLNPVDLTNESPVPYTPIDQRYPDADESQPLPPADRDSSIVYDTPVRDSQLQDLPYYKHVFGQGQPAEPDNDQVNAQKRRKLTQAYA